MIIKNNVSLFPCEEPHVGAGFLEIGYSFLMQLLSSI